MTYRNFQHNLHFLTYPIKSIEVIQGNASTTSPKISTGFLVLYSSFSTLLQNLLWYQKVRLKIKTSQKPFLEAHTLTPTWTIHDKIKWCDRSVTHRELEKVSLITIELMQLLCGIKLFRPDSFVISYFCRIMSFFPLPRSLFLFYLKCATIVKLCFLRIVVT